ncbi:MAG: hypothetical protein ABIO71_01180 [Caldimonas sp.]
MEAPPPTSTSGWAGPSRRARGFAAALAIALAALTVLVVNTTWRLAAPPPPAPVRSVEARLIAAPLPPSAPRPANR